MRSIPRQIHQIWIGPDPQPTDFISSWVQHHKDWPHFLWNEKAIDNELHWTDGARKVYDQYMQDERYCGAANVARAFILEEYGGVYIDADMRCLHSLETAWFMEHENWIAQSPHEPSRSQNAAMGAAKGSRLMANYVFALDLVGLEEPMQIHPSWQKTGAVLFDQERAKPYMKNEDLAIVPSPAFFVHQKNGAVNPAMANYRGQIYGDHKFYSTHGRKMPA